MAGFSNYLENELLDHALGTGAFTMPSNVYVSLHTADPGETGANEVTGGSYARQVATFGAAASGTTSNSGDLSFTDMPAATVTHVGVWDASSAGNPLFLGALSSAKVVNSGDTFRISTGDLDVTLD